MYNSHLSKMYREENKDTSFYKLILKDMTKVSTPCKFPMGYGP